MLEVETLSSRARSPLFPDNDGEALETLRKRYSALLAEHQRLQQASREANVTRQQLQTKTQAIELLVQEKRTLEDQLSALHLNLQLLQQDRHSHQQPVDQLQYKISALQQVSFLCCQPFFYSHASHSHHHHLLHLLLQAQAGAVSDGKALQARLLETQHERDSLSVSLNTQSAQLSDERAAIRELERRNARLSAHAEELQKEKRGWEAREVGNRGEDKSQMLAHQLSQVRPPIVVLFMSNTHPHTLKHTHSHIPQALAQLDEVRGERSALSSQLSEVLAAEKQRRAEEQTALQAREAALHTASERSLCGLQLQLSEATAKATHLEEQLLATQQQQQLQQQQQTGPAQGDVRNGEQVA